METKPLLYGLIGFFIGGLIVSVAATQMQGSQSAETSMSQMTADLENKSGDDYDRAFVSHMIAHHQAAVDMAKLSESRAKHQEVKDLSMAVIAAQEQEINTMKQWRSAWGDDNNAPQQLHEGH